MVDIIDANTLAHALQSIGTDELISRITDSTGTGIDPAKEGQLPANLTGSGNLKQSIEEQSIAPGIDIQARYATKDFKGDYSLATGAFYMPASGNVDLSQYKGVTFFVYVTAGGTSSEVIDAYLQVSLDGANFYRATDEAGNDIKLSSANITRGQWNALPVTLQLEEAKLEIVVSGEAPGDLQAGYIAKA